MWNFALAIRIFEKIWDWILCHRQSGSIWIIVKQLLTLFTSTSHFYTPKKRQRSFGFLMSSGILEMENWREIFFRDNKLIPMMFSIKSSNFFLLNFAHIRHTYFTNIIVYYDPHIFHIHFHSSVVCCIIEQLLKISKTKKMKKNFFFLLTLPSQYDKVKNIKTDISRCPWKLKPR